MNTDSAKRLQKIREDYSDHVAFKIVARHSDFEFLLQEIDRREELLRKSYAIILEALPPWTFIKTQAEWKANQALILQELKDTLSAQGRGAE